MDKKNLMPHQAQPVVRITTGQLPVELIEEVLGSNAACSSNVLASIEPISFYKYKYHVK